MTSESDWWAGCGGVEDLKFIELGMLQARLIGISGGRDVNEKYLTNINIK